LTPEDTHSAQRLSDREQSVLRIVVHNYIQSAIPVGSRYISKHFEPQLSAASIRNVMADLEERGLLSHPHTSAGRIPTDLGYRFYVDYLMEMQQISDGERANIHQQLDPVSDTEELLRETSKILGKITRQLSIVTSPHLSSGVFEKLELIPVGGARLLVVISVRTGIVRTIMIEVGMEIRRDHLELVARMLNERLSGLTLSTIRETFVDRMKDLQDEQSGLVRLFIDSVDQLFSDTKEKEKLHIAGTGNIIDQPEFGDPRNFRSVIELIENEDIIVHLLEKHEGQEQNFVVTIGAENKDDSVNNYSLVTATYNVDGVSGRVGIMGPTRMNYSKVIPLVDYVAKTIAQMMMGRQ
jgi:heat-inducible transcriptional repressor